MTNEQKEIRRQRARAWNDAHPERLKASQTRYRQTEKYKASRRKYYLTHKDQCALTVKRFVEKRPWYWSWITAKQRCQNPNNPRFARYGGRGIKFLLTEEQVIELWKRDNAQYLNCPSIDRIDNDGNYCFENCQFIERAENGIKGLKLYWERRRTQAEKRD